jgi:hypothetical protein
MKRRRLPGWVKWRSRRPGVWGIPILLSLLAVFVFCTVGFGASCPEVDILKGIHEKGLQGLSVAVDGAGRVYVSDYTNDIVKVFDRHGRFLRARPMKSPLGVGVGPEGKVYIGRVEGFGLEAKAEVGIYDSSLRQVGVLGQGLGEFRWPVAVEVHGERVYVVDRDEDLVKVYDRASGQWLFSFGQGGQLAAPSGIAIEPLSGDIYVADHALRYDPEVKRKVYGAGVHKFNSQGELLKSFGTWGTEHEPGVMLSPSGAVWAGGRLLVADHAKSVLHVFDPEGNPLCLLEAGLALPRGLEYVPDGRLLVASPGGVRVLGLDAYTFLVVSPTSMSYEGQLCGQDPTEGLTLTNTGKGTLQWSLESATSWLSPELSSGQLGGGESTTVNITALLEGLSEGSYEGSLRVSYEGGAETVGASLQVGPAPQLEVSPTSMEFSAKGAEDPEPQELSLKVEGLLSGSLSWSVQDDAEWLEASPSRGDATLALVEVAAHVEGLESGHYEASLTVSADCTHTEPKSVAVALDYIKGGTIRVRTNLQEATFSIQGPESLGGSGTEAVFEGVPEGTYTIQYGRVQGFKSPASESFYVGLGETVELYGLYEDLRELNDIAAAPWGPLAKAEIRLYDSQGEEFEHLRLLGRGYSPRHLASGELDGQGPEELVLALKKGREEGYLVVGFRTDGTALEGLSFRASGRVSSLALGELDGQGPEELILASRQGEGAVISIYAYDGASVARLHSLSVKTGPRGAQVAAGQLDGEGPEELVVVAQRGKALEVSIWQLTEGGLQRAGGFELPLARGASAYLALALAVADADADGLAEILLAYRPQRRSAPVVELYGPEGRKVGGFAFSAQGRVSLAAADVDYDGQAEVLLGDGPSPRNTGSFRLYEADGTFLGKVRAFGRYGTMITLGRFK